MRRLHLKPRDPHNERFTAVGNSEEGALGDAVGSDDVIAVVRKLFAWLQARQFADNAVPLNDYLFTGSIGDDPFPAANGNRFG